MMRTFAVVFLQCIVISLAEEVKPAVSSPAVQTTPLNLTSLLAAANPINSLPKLPSLPTPPPIIPCTCGVFLTGQFAHGSHKPPSGYPALLHEYETPFVCTPAGQKQCANKCLEVIARHLPHSGTIICGTIDRDCFKERAYLWTKNCNDVWVNSNMSAGKEFCCKDGLPYKCPLGKQ
ncbi:follicle cell protein 3C-1 [Macrosteles quadrilineatus]|uniref:follicle cell protein 3C-1 n=1 Tax=Macrosteles quadrilineatus TaxID=74068 RepID=UPI0023E0B5F4|nr:follicle cell protein 3C-1 [Macrosteles quadrilineatus]XP_054271678.1 follicle cell protein 3C-1 [Macrosteles quadrilineatus]